MPKTDIKTYTLRLTDSEAEQLESIRQDIPESTTAATLKHLINYYFAQNRTIEKHRKKIAELENENRVLYKKVKSLKDAFDILLE